MAVKASVVRARTAAVAAIERRGARRAAVTIARPDAAKTTNAMAASDVFGSLPNRDWYSVAGKMWIALRRKRTPMVANAAPPITAASLRPPGEPLPPPGLQP